MIIPETRAPIGPITCFAAAAVLGVAFSTILPRLEDRIIYIAGALAIYAVVGWYRLLDTTERVMICTS